jgi:hypothetical protein
VSLVFCLCVCHNPLDLMPPTLPNISERIHRFKVEQRQMLQITYFWSTFNITQQWASKRPEPWGRRRGRSTLQSSNDEDDDDAAAATACMYLKRERVTRRIDQESAVRDSPDSVDVSLCPRRVHHCYMSTCTCQPIHPCHHSVIQHLCCGQPVAAPHHPHPPLCKNLQLKCFWGRQHTQYDQERNPTNLHPDTFEGAWLNGRNTLSLFLSLINNPKL